jgi:ADP-ribose pyrophosphatase YjhB (NUDIX family)
LTVDVPCVGAIVIDQGERILLVRRANPPAEGLWSIPGGRVEPGEPVESAVLRELREETGVTGLVVREVGTVHRDAPSGDRYVIRDYLVTVSGSPEPTAGDDAADAAWFALGELRRLETSPGLVDALIDWGVIPS